MAGLFNKLFGGEQINKSTQTAIGMLEEKLDELQQTHKQELEKHAQANKKRLDELQIKYDKALVQQEDLHQDKLDRVEIKYDKVVAQQEKSYENKLNEMHIQYEQKLGGISIEYNQKLENQKVEYEQKLEEHIQANKKELDEIQIRYDKALVQQENLYQDRLDRIEIKYDKIVVQQEKTYEQKLEEYIQMNKKRLDEIQIKYDEALVQQEDSYQDKLDQIEMNYNEGVQQIKDELVQVKNEMQQIVQQKDSEILAKAYEIQALQSELAAQKHEIEKIRLELTKQQEVENLQPQEVNLVAKNEDTAVKIEETKETAVEEQQPVGKKNLLDSILNYEWDDEEDFDFMESYESKPVKQISTEIKEEDIGGVEVQGNKDIYEQFKDYMAQNQIYDNPSKEFVLHAKWMAEYEEQQMPLEAVPFNSKEPVYKEMSKEQLKWYFYWRTNARKDKFENIDIGYIILYTYEILNNIGIKNYEEGHKKLISILQEYGQEYRDVEGQLPQWIHDYLIIYGNPRKLLEVFEELKEVSHTSHFVMRANFIRCLLSRDYLQITDLLNQFSEYKVVRERVYKDERYKEIYDKILLDVVNNIDKYFIQHENSSFAKRIIGEVKVDRWKVFNHAPVEISTIESLKPHYSYSKEIRYWYEDSQWYTTYAGMRNEFDRSYITMLLKSIEGAICKRVNIKRELRIGTIPSYMEKFIREGIAKYCPVIPDVQQKVNNPIGTSIRKVLQEPESLAAKKVNWKQVDNIYSLIDKYNRANTQEQNAYNFFVRAKRMEKQDDFYMELEAQTTQELIEYRLIQEYFKWRKQVRKGIYEDAQRIYVYTYIYEIINGIGISQTEQGVEVLSKILKEYGIQYEGLQEQLSRWIIDYAIYYRCIPEDKFYTVLDYIDIASPASQNWSILAILQEKENSSPLYYLNRISSYDIYKSQYYSRANEVMINDVLKGVLSQIGNVLLANKQPSLYEIVVKNNNKEKEWIPFMGVPFYDKTKYLLLSNHKSYTIDNKITYSIKRGIWKTTKPYVDDLRHSQYIGRLLRGIEYYVCKSKGMYITGENIIITSYLEELIDKTVKSYVRDKKL